MRYALRTLLRSPGFAAAAILTLGLGIGANTAIFSAVDAALLRPLPLSHPERLAQIWETHPSFPHLAVAFPDYLDWRTQSKSFEQIAAWGFQSFQLTGAGEAEILDGSIVSDNFLSTIGLRPAQGRDFAEGETQAVLLGDRLWRRKFNSDPKVVGQNIRLNGASFLVVGVLPGPQILPKDVELLTPFGTMVSDFDRTNRTHHVVRVVGRLKPGVTLEQASTEIRGMSLRMEHDYPATNKTIGSTLVPMVRELEGDSRTPLLVLLAVVGLVLLIATANVANLLLARAAGRRKEIAIRIALGAGRGQIMRQLLTESLLLSGAGGVLGATLAVVATPWLRILAEGRIARAAEIAVDGGVLLFAMGVALATGILFGLVPALAVTRDQNADLRSAGRESAGNLHRSLRAMLVTGQVALAMVVLVGAALLTRSLMRLTGVDPGFRVEHLLTARVALPGGYQTPEKISGFYRQLFAAMAATPGVKDVAGADATPLSQSYGSTRFAVDGEATPEPGRYPVADAVGGSPNYFAFMGVPLTAGRAFTEHDVRTDEGTPVIVNDALARQYYHGSAVGRNLILGVLSPKPSRHPIIGVVADTREQVLSKPAEPTMYFASYAGYGRSEIVLVRTAGDPLAMAGVLRRQVAAIDREAPVSEVRTMEEIVDKSLAGRKFSVLLISLFGALALVLAAVGLYGVVSYSVTQRNREMGLRMALGAQQSEVLRMVIGEAMKLAIAGAVAGAVAAAFAGQALATELYGVRTGDPASFAGATAVLLIVTLMGAWIPARRAMKVDPAIALRDD
jgi:putative ABC transport system permease protein